MAELHSTMNEKYWGGGIPWITPKDLSNYKSKYISRGNKNISLEGLKKSSAKELPKGSVLLSTRTPIGYVVIASNMVTTNQGFRNLIVKGNNLSEYIYYFLKLKKDLLNSLGSGVTFKELSSSKLKTIPSPLAPIPEQRVIVKKIETLFSLIDQSKKELETAKEKLKLYCQSVLKKEDFKKTIRL